MKSFLKQLYLSNRFFKALALLVLGYFVCFVFTSLLIVMHILMGVFFALFIIDCYSLYKQKNGVEGTRICPDRFSNGDRNKVTITIENRYAFRIHIEVVEEAPFQFQERGLIFERELASNELVELTYNIIPTERGVYKFGNINVFVSSTLALISRRYILPVSKEVAVYPSFIEMHKYELLAASNRLTEFGVKPIRRIGNATEFEHIKQYVLGDDTRTINYKASARTNELMVNTYTEERSQPIYSIIDKGRTMQMPFNEMTLLDYAINSALMFSSTALRKGDKAGLITFSSDVDDILIASEKLTQRNRILEMLYAQKTNFKEASYDKLFATTRRVIKQRSLIMLYTNFESLSGLRRQLKYLRLMATKHLVVVVFFLNSELDETLSDSPEDVEGLFRKSTAEKLAMDKLLIHKELMRYGIHTILTSPGDLTITTINKYLELKARGLI